MLVGAVADVFAEAPVCWVKPHNASAPVRETCEVLNTGTNLEAYTRKKQVFSLAEGSCPIVHCILVK